MCYTFQNHPKLVEMLKRDNPVLTVMVAELQKLVHYKDGPEGLEVTCML